MPTFWVQNTWDALYHQYRHLGILIAAFSEQHYFRREICVTIKRVSWHTHKGCLDAVWHWLSTCGPYSLGHRVFHALECVALFAIQTGPCTIGLPSRKCWIHRAELNKDIKAMVVLQSREFFAVGIQQPMCWWNVSTAMGALCNVICLIQTGFTWMSFKLGTVILRN